MRLYYFTSLDLEKARSGARDHIEGVVSGLVRLGWEVTLFSSALGGKTRPPDLGCRHILTPKRDLSVRSQGLEQMRLLRILLQKDPPSPDAVYVRYAFSMLTPFLYALRMGVPYFLEVNAVARLESIHPRLAGLGVALENRALRQARQTFVVTRELCDLLARRASLPAKRFTVMPNGVDDALLRNGHRSFDRARPTVGFLGTFQERQGIETLLRALPRVIEVVPEVRIVLAGHGAELERSVRRARELSLEDRVSFPGRVDKQEIGPLVQTFDVAVAPFTPLQERLMGSPVKLFTYLACGAPVVTTTLPSLDVFRGCPAVLFARPDDPADLAEKIIRTLRTPSEQRRELAETARAFVRKGHTWSQIARRTASIIEAAIEEPEP
jgi:glycosyltransferase involved in cell wall biosynthesis